MARSCGAAFLMLLAAHAAQAQGDALSAFSDPQQLAVYFDMLTRLKVAVERTDGDHAATYKAVSLRLYACARVYERLAQTAEGDAARTRYTKSGEFYAHAAVGLYPDSLAELQQDYAESLKSPKPSHALSARLCDELSERDMAAVYRAVRDLTAP